MIKKKLQSNSLLLGVEPSFPIVGIGASAGGLEALEILLRNIPDKCGVAFVIVQHLDPTHKDMMVELLQRVTAMPVVQVSDRLKIKPDHVYVIPPNKNMSLLHEILHLLDPGEPRGLRLPIDFFFHSLADDLHQQSIGLILSGMGSDGSLGLRAIKEKGGGSFVQDPSSAKFDGMPRSAIAACTPDIIAPVEELPGKLLAYLGHVHFVVKKDFPLAEKVLSGLEKVVIFRSIKKAPSTDVLNDAWVFIKLKKLLIMSIFCRKTPMKLICCSRNC